MDEGHGTRVRRYSYVGVRKVIKMRDYIVAVDENGQPYLAHAGEGLSQTGSSGTTGRRRANSKYIMKIQTRYGNRYFYTPQEVQAYQQAKNGIKNVAQKVDQARRTLKSDLKKRKTMKEAQKEAATSLKDVEHLTGRWYKARIETPAEAAYDKKFAEATKKTYDKTKLGKAENAAKEAVSSAVNNVKSKSDRMKEEFRKKKEDVKDKLGVDEKERAEKTREEVKATKERLEKAQRELDISDKDMDKMFTEDSAYAKKHWDELNRGEKAHAQDAFDRYAEKLHARNKADDEAVDARIANRKAEEEYDKTPLGKAENAKDAVKDVKDKAVEAVNKAKDKVDDIASSTKRSKYSEYKENDSDFDDKNYDEKNRVGDTDFFSFKGKDGRTVIVEEDMKWTLPKGVDPNSPEIHAALKKFASQVESAREMNNSAYTGQEWRDAVTEAIDDASREALKKK